MAYSSYGWASKPATPTPTVPLKPGPDPEHLSPTDQQYVDMPPLWVESGSGVPTLPPEYWSSDGVGVTLAPGGPIDTTPQSGSWGVGVGPGLTTEEAQEIRLHWNNMPTDLAARTYVAPTDRDAQPTVDVLDDVPGHGDSPQTNLLKITGVGGTDDVYARTGRRIQRAWPRVWDMHRYAVETRAMTIRNAKVAQPQGVVPGATQYDSPFPTAATEWATMQPDNFTAPQIRRVPQPWDQAITVDAAGPVDDSWQLWSP